MHIGTAQRTTSTRQLLGEAVMQVYREMDPALRIVTLGTPEDIEFECRDDLYVSREEEQALNPFLRQVAGDVRRDHDGRCPSDVLLKEATRRMRLAIRAVAGRQDTPDGRHVSAEEIHQIRNPILQTMVWHAALGRADVTWRPFDRVWGASDRRDAAMDDSHSTEASSGSGSGMPHTSYGSSGGGMDPDGSGFGSRRTRGHGPDDVGDFPVDGPVSDGHGGWGPDGPSRSSGGGGGYIGGYPLF